MGATARRHGRIERYGVRLVAGAAADDGGDDGGGPAAILREFHFVPGMMVMRVTRDREVAACEALAALDAVVYAHPDYYGEAQALQLADDYPEQWGLNNTGQCYPTTLNSYGYLGGPGVVGADIRAPCGWSVLSEASPSVIIAVIDSGVNYLHPDLTINMWTNPGEIPDNCIDDDDNGYKDDVHGIGTDAVGEPGWCTEFDLPCWGPTPSYGYGDPFDTDHGDLPNKSPLNPGGHGTGIALVIAAQGNNAVFTRGVAWKARMMALRCYNASCSLGVSDTGLVTSLIEALQYSASEGARVVNLSLAFGINFPALEDAMAALNAAGLIAVVGAGNNNDSIDSPTLPNVRRWPALYTFPNMLVVGAMDHREQRSIWGCPGGQCPPGSNWGPESVDVFAPGSWIRVPIGSTQSIGGPYALGTSFAAPHASGACALVWTLNPSWTAAQVVGHIVAKARPSPNLAALCVSGGVLDIGAALGADCVPPEPVSCP